MARGESSKRAGKRPVTDEEPELISPPWPREPGQPIIDDDVPIIPDWKIERFNNRPDYRRRSMNDRWTKYMSICYNGLLRVKLEPTRFIHPETLTTLGMIRDIRNLLRKTGLGNLGWQYTALYPELTRQFLASCEVYYPDGEKVAQEGVLTYFAYGFRYSISIPDLCVLYGFDPNATHCSLPNNDEWTESQALWDYIAQPVRNISGRNLTLIRNPTLRIVAKILGNVLYSKAETSAIRIEELFLMYCGLGDFVHPLFVHPENQDHQINMGAVLAGIWADKKVRFLNNTDNTKEYCGNLLTPLFRHHGLDMAVTGQEVDRRRVYIDDKYLRRAHYCFDKKFNFFTLDGQQSFITLPHQATRLNCLENIRFDIREDVEPTAGATPRMRAPTTAEEGEPSHTTYHPQQHFEDSGDFVLPPYHGEFRLPPYNPHDPQSVKLDVMLERQGVLHTMMERIMGALSHVPRMRRPSCFRPGNTSPSRPVSPPTTAHEDVAGRTSRHSPTPEEPLPQSGQSEEEEQPRVSLRRSRRKIRQRQRAQSQSESSLEGV